MSLQKKIIAAFLGLFLMLSNAIPVLAASKFFDVKEDFRAYKEIDDVVTKGIITPIEDGVFAPWAIVTRVEFAGMLLRALKKNNVEITIRNRYSDVTPSTNGYYEILRSDQVGTTVGFPDGTFKPDVPISKTETETMLAHITNDTSFIPELLTQFPDYKEIAGWATKPYAQSIKYNLYYNDPDPFKLTPMATLHRYEAAVLLSRLSSNLDLVKEQFRPVAEVKPAPEPEPVAEAPKQPEPPREYILSAEHFDIYPEAACNRVTMTNFRRIVLAKNVFKVAYLESFNSKKHTIGETEVFYFKTDVKTVEGTTIFPANTKLYAKVHDIKAPKALNKNAQVYFDFQELEFPSGNKVPMTARVLNGNDGWVVENYWQKPLEYIIGGAAVGTGVGLAIGAPQDKLGTGLAIGIPAGAVVGGATGFLTKGVNFKARANEEILIELKLDCNIYNN